MYRTRQSWRQRVIIHIKNKHYGLISKNKNEIQIYRFPITLKFKKMNVEKFLDTLVAICVNFVLAGENSALLWQPLFTKYNL